MNDILRLLFSLKESFLDLILTLKYFEISIITTLVYLYIFLDPLFSPNSFSVVRLFPNTDRDFITSALKDVPTGFIYLRLMSFYRTE